MSYCPGNGYFLFSFGCMLTNFQGCDVTFSIHIMLMNTLQYMSAYCTFFVYLKKKKKLDET